MLYEDGHKDRIAPNWNRAVSVFSDNPSKESQRSGIWEHFSKVWPGVRQDTQSIHEFADYWYDIQDVIKPVEKNLWSRNIENVDSHLK